MGLSALRLRPKHYSLLLLFHFSLILMAVSLKPLREGLYVFIGPRLHCVICHSSTSLKYQTKSIWFYSPKPQALHGHPSSIHARHDKACPCDNSLLTLLFSDGQCHSHWSKPLFWEWLHHKDIREGLQGFFYTKAGNSNCPKSTT